MINRIPIIFGEGCNLLNAALLNKLIIFIMVFDNDNKRRWGV